MPTHDAKKMTSPALASAAPARARGPKRPGRPVGDTNLRESIIDAAEAVFAEVGYVGATLREVAARARVTQALISYYFRSKYGLYEATFLRRSAEVSQQRIENLERLRAGGKRVRVRQIVEAFLTPTLALRTTPGGRLFLRMQARLHTEPADLSYRLRADAYDRSTHLYASALQEALPALSPTDVYWRITLMVGAYMYAFSDTHRLGELAPKACDPENPVEIINQIVAFVVGGFEAKPGA